MSFAVSRRRWLLSATITTLTASSIHAEAPPAPIGRRASASSLPIPTRTIRLRNLGEMPAVVTAIAADPRGELVAASGDDHAIRILRTSNMTTVRTLKGHRDIIRTMSFDPAGDRLVSAGNDGQLILWDRDESFRELQRMAGTPALARVRFSGDGREMAAVGFDNEVFLIGRRDRQRPIFDCDCRDLRAVAYRDDNQVLAVAGRSGDLHLFDPHSGLISDDPLHNGRIHDIAFHPQSKQLICVSEDGEVTVYDTETRRLLRRISVTTGKLFSLAILDSPLVAVAGSDNVIRLVNTDDGLVVRELRGHTGSVSTLAAAGGFLFSGSYDATLRRWTIGDIDEQAQRIAEGDPRIDR